LHHEFDDAVSLAALMLNSDGSINSAATSIPALSAGGCSFYHPNPNPMSVKCWIILNLGEALHGIQDFYAHSNYADQPNPNNPISVTNPPGLDLLTPAPFMDLTLPSFPKDKINNPSGAYYKLATGCSRTTSLGELLWNCPDNRINHDYLAKDDGFINVDSSTGTVTTTCDDKYPRPFRFLLQKVAHPCTTWPRSVVAGNFANAVNDAVLDSKRVIKDFANKLTVSYGQVKGSLLFCALTHDNPVQDCHSSAPPANWAPYTGNRGSPYYSWNVAAAEPSSVVARVGVNGSGQVAYAEDGTNPDDSVFLAQPSVDKLPTPPDAAWTTTPLPLEDSITGLRAFGGVALNDAGQVATSFSTLTTSSGTFDHVQLLQEGANAIRVADGGDPAVPPFTSLGASFAVNASGTTAFTGTLQNSSTVNVFTPVNPPAGGDSASDYNSPAAPDDDVGDIDGLAIDNNGDVLVPETLTSPKELLLYDQTFSTVTTIASTGTTAGACAPPSGGGWTALGARPAISPDGTAIAFAAQASGLANPGVYLCYQTTTGGPWNVTTVAGGPNPADLGYTASDAPISASLDHADMNSSITLADESSTGDHPATPGLHPGTSIVVGFAAHPICSPAPCPADPSVSHLIASQRGIWAAEVTVQPAPAAPPGGQQGSAAVEVRRPWPVLQTGDYIDGYQVTNLDATPGVSQDTPLWFAMASHYVQGNGINDAGNHYVALAIQAQTPAGDPVWLVLRGDHTDIAGDGLLDGWKTNGIYFTGSTTPDIGPLPAANIYRKDLYVHVDSMSTCPAQAGYPCPPNQVPPPPSVMDDAQAIFAHAPVADPQGKGIDLNIESPSCTQSDATGCVPYEEYIQGGSDDDVVDGANTQPLVNYETGYLDEEDPSCTVAKPSDSLPSQSCIAEEAAKALAYRYILFAANLSDATANNGDGGEARVAGWASGSYCQQPGSPPTCATYQWGGPAAVVTMAQGDHPLDPALLEIDEVGTTVHDLGLTLGLDHGGGDDINCKPNYPSVMNYKYELPTDAQNYLSKGFSLFTSQASNTVNDQAIPAGDECDASPQGTVLYGYNDWSSLQYGITWGLASPSSGSLTPTVADPGNQASTVGTAQSLPILASDPFGQPLTFTATGLPSGLTIDPATGVISGTPTTAGSADVTVTATDQASASGSVSFTWVIAAPGSAHSTVHHLPSRSLTDGASGIGAGDIGSLSPAVWWPLWAKGDIANDGVTNANSVCPFVYDPTQDPAACATTISVADSSALEVDAGATGQVAFPVTVSGTLPSSPITVDYATSDGTAKAGQDYVATSGTLTISTGKSSGEIDVPLIGQSTEQPSKSFTMTLSNASGAGIVVPGSATGAIVDDGPYIPPQVSTGDISVTQPTSGTATAHVPVTLTGPSRDPVTVSYATANGTATAGVDYRKTSGNLTIKAGHLSGTISVTILPSATSHPPRTFTVTLSNPVKATLGTATATVTLVSQVPPSAPVLSGTAGDSVTNLTWTVPASGTSPITGYTIYRATSPATLTELAQVSAATTTYQDTAVTNGTTYYYEVTASSSVGEGPKSNEVSLTPASATVPGAPVVTAKSGNGLVKLTWPAPSPGGAPISSFIVSRATKTGKEVTLVQLGGSARSYKDTAVTNGTTYYYQVAAVNSFGSSPASNEVKAAPAAPPSPLDLTAMPGNAVVHLRWELPASTGGKPVASYQLLRGTTSGGETILTAITGGSTLTYDDTTAVNGTTYYYEIEATSAAGTGPPSAEMSATPSATATPSIYIPDDTITPGGAGTTATLTIPVALSDPAPTSTTVEIYTHPITAQPQRDYQNIDTPVTFPAGTTTENVPVTIDGNGTYQGSVTFSVNVGTITGNLAVGRGSGIATINSHSPPPVISVGAVKTNENQNSLNFPVTLTGPTTIPASVQYTTLDGSAHAPGDYTTTTGTLTIPVGHTTGMIPVPIVNHTLTASSVTLQMALYNPVGATIKTGVGTGTITGSGPTACQLTKKVTWTGNGGDDNWSTAGNWSTQQVPSTSSNVCISTGTKVIVDKPAMAASLEADVPLMIDARLQLTSTTQGSTFAGGGTLSGPDSAELDVAGTLDITAGTFTWGQIFPPGPTDVGWSSTFGGVGTVIVHSGATLEIGGSECTQRWDPGTYLGGCLSFTPALRNDGTVDLANGTLFRDSTQPWTNAGTLILGDYPADSNVATKIWGGCPTPSSGTTCNPFPLTNSGTIDRIAGPDTTVLQNVQLATNGTVQLSGTLDIINQDWTASLGGAWTVSTGAALQLGGTNMAVTLAPGATMSGGGTLQLGYGAPADLDIAGTFSLPTVVVSAGQLTVENALTLTDLTLTSGSIQGPGSITLPSTPASTFTMSGGTLALTGDFTIDSGASATWSAGSIAGPGTVIIDGTLNMTGGTGNLAGPLMNNGAINWTGGTLSGQVGGSFTNAGTLKLTPSDPNDMPHLNDQSGGTFTFTNTGLVTMNGGNSGLGADLDGYTEGRTGGTTVASGVLTLRPPAGVTASLGGGATVTAGATLELDAAVTGTAGPGGFVLPAGATLSQTGTGPAPAMLLVDTNTNNWGTAAGLNVELAGTDNLPGLTVAGGNGTTETTTTVDPGVSLALQSLTIAPHSMLAVGGSVTVGSGGTATLAGDVTGAGSFTLASGATGTWSNGMLSVLGSSSADAVTVASGATLNLAGGQLFLNGPLVNHGTVNWTTGTVFGQSSATVTNTGTWSMTPQSSTISTWPHLSSDGTLTFTNTSPGTITLNGGSNGYGADLDGIVGGTGGITVTSGVLTLRPPPGVTASLAGGASVAAGATLELEAAITGTVGPGGFKLPAGATLSGGGTLSVDTNINNWGTAAGLNVELAGTDNLPGLAVAGGNGTTETTTTVDPGVSLALQSLNIASHSMLAVGGSVTVGSGGTATLAGDVTGAGSLTLASGATGTWSSGSWSVLGSSSANAVTVASGATLNLAGGDLFLNGLLVNHGTVNWTTGTMFGQVSATVTNTGTWSMTPQSSNTSTWPHLSSDGTLTFTNTSPGTITLNGGSNGYGADLDGIVGGTGGITVTSGVLTLRPPSGVTASLAGGAAVAAGATLELEAAITGTAGPGGFKLPTGATLTGAGTLALNTNLNGWGTVSGLNVELAGTDNLANLINGGSADNLSIDSQILNLSTYSQSAQSTLQTTLTSNSNYGAINTTGAASIGGTIAITLAGTYQPAVGTSFTVINAQGGLTGTFNSITNPSGETYAATYPSNTATLTRAS
jgi:hypothetical protein